MAQPDKLLFSLEVEENDAEKKVTALRIGLAALRKEKAELDKANKAGKLSEQEYATSLGALNKAIKTQGAALKEQVRNLDLQEKAATSAAGSLNQLKAQLATMTGAYNKLSAEERKNSEERKNLQNTIRGLSDELKAEEGALGNATRNVGNYAASIEEAIAGNGKFSGAIGGAVDTLKELSGGLKNKVAEFKGMTEGMGGAQKASVAFGLSLKALGIGLVIQAIAAVIGFLTRMDAGMDKVEQATAAVSAAFTVLIKAIAPIGEAIINAFEHRLDSIAALGQAVLHPIDSFNKLRQSASNFADNVGADMSRAARAAADYTAAMQDIEDAEDGLIAQRARVGKQLDQALLAVKDRSRSEKERIGLLNAAGRAEQDLANKTESLAKQKLDRLLAFQKAQGGLQDADRKKAQGGLQDADRKKAQEAEADYINAQRESANVQQAIQNRRIALIEQEAAARKAAAESSLEAQKKAAAESVAQAERALIMAQRKGEDTLKIEQEIIDRKAILEKIGLAKNSQARLLIDAQTNLARYELEVQHAAKILSLNKQTAVLGLEAQLALTQKGSSTELRLQLALIRAKAAAEKAELEKTSVTTLAERANRNAQLARIDADTQKATLDAETAFVAEQVRTRQEAADKTAAMNKALFDKIGKFSAGNLAEQRDELEARLINAAQGSRDELELRKALIRNRQAIELQAEGLTASARKRINAQANRDILEADRAFISARLTTIANIAEGVNGVLSKLIETNITAQTKALDKQQAAALSNAALSADQRAAIEKNFQKKREKLELDAAKKRKKIATVENVINTARAVTVALSSGFDPITRAISVAIAIATGAASQVAIESQQFARGGVYRSDGKGAYITGPGSTTSDSINARLSTKESVINAKSTAMFYDQLSAMNVAGGGNPFPGSAQIAATAMPGAISGYAGGGVSQQVIDYQKLGAAVAQAYAFLPPSVVSVKEVVDVAERRRVQALDNDA